MYLLLDIIMRFVEITSTIVKENETKNITENDNFYYIHYSQRLMLNGTYKTHYGEHMKEHRI